MSTLISGACARTRVDEAVADTGVFVRWFVEQPGWEHALEVRDAFLQGSVVLSTIDFVRVETADVLRKRGLLPGILDAESFAAAVRAIDDLGVTVHPTDAERLERAARLASTRMLAVYDAVLVVLALELGLPLLTTDAKLCRAVEGLLSTTLLRGSAG